MGPLTLHFIPYGDIKNLDSDGRIKMFLRILIKNKIVLLQGKLKPFEEIKLIEETMGLVGTSIKFKGIELATITSKEKTLFSIIKQKLVSLLIGDRDALTIIGPATIVKKIRRDPKKVELFLRKWK